MLHTWGKKIRKIVQNMMSVWFDVFKYLYILYKYRITYIILILPFILIASGCTKFSGQKLKTWKEDIEADSIFKRTE